MEADEGPRPLVGAGNSALALVIWIVSLTGTLS